MFKRYRRHEDRAGMAEELGLDNEPMGMDFDESSDDSDSDSDSNDQASDAGSASSSGSGTGSLGSDSDEAEHPKLAPSSSKRKREQESGSEDDADQEGGSDSEGQGNDDDDDDDDDAGEDEGSEEEANAPVLPPKSVAQTLEDPIAVEANAPTKKGYHWRTCIVCPWLKLKEEHSVELHTESKRHLRRLAAYAEYAKKELTAEQMSFEGEGMVDPRHLTAELDALLHKSQVGEPTRKEAKVQASSESKDKKTNTEPSVLDQARKGHVFSPTEWAVLSSGDKNAVMRVQRIAKRMAKRKQIKAQRKQASDGPSKPAQPQLDSKKGPSTGKKQDEQVPHSKIEKEQPKPTTSEAKHKKSRKSKKAPSSDAVEA